MKNSKTVLSKAQKRVLIAKDVLKHLKSKFLKSTPNMYCELVPKDKRKGIFKNDDLGKELQKLLPKRVKACEVCALGSMFISHIIKFDNFKFNQHHLNESHVYCLGDDGEMRDQLKKYFSREQLKLIENCYEGFGNEEGPQYLRQFDKEYEKYGTRTRKDPGNKRLKAIMNNIIRNKGVFIPQQDIKQ